MPKTMRENVIEAVENNELDKVKEYYEQDMSIINTNYFGKNLAQVAANNASLDVLKWFIEDGIIAYPGNLLEWAARGDDEKHLETVKWLFQNTSEARKADQLKEAFDCARSPDIKNFIFFNYKRIAPTMIYRIPESDRLSVEKSEDKEKSNHVRLYAELDKHLQQSPVIDLTDDYAGIDFNFYFTEDERERMDNYLSVLQELKQFKAHGHFDRTIPANLLEKGIIPSVYDLLKMQKMVTDTRFKLLEQQVSNLTAENASLKRKITEMSQDQVKTSQAMPNFFC